MSTVNGASTKPLGSVLVIGGCGFLGHHIVQALSVPPYLATVSVFDLHTERNCLPDVAYYSGDLTDASTVASVLAKVQPTIIIHTASPVASGNVPKHVFYKVNVVGTQVLLDAAKACSSVRAFVYTSSASVVHDSVSDLHKANEKLPVLRAPQQHEYYSETKGIADELVLAYNNTLENGMRTVCIRPAAIFGEGDVQMIPNLIATLDAGKTNVQLGNNTKPFDFTYVGNVAYAHLLAAESLLATTKSASADKNKVDGEAFFVTNDDPLPFWTFARLVWSQVTVIEAGPGKKVAPFRSEKVTVIPRSIAIVIAVVMEWVYWVVFLGKKQPVLTLAKTRYVTMERTYDISKAKERLGYQPKYSMEEGVERAVRWVRGKTSDAKKAS